MSRQPSPPTTVAAERDRALRLLIENLPTILWTTDRDLEVTAVFGAGTGSLDRPEREVVGATIAELFQADPSAPAIEAHARAMAGEATTYEQEFGGRLFHCHVEPIHDNGSVVGVSGVALDITDRVRAERRVEEAEVRYRSLVEQVPAVVYSSPARGRDEPEYVSPRIVDLLGKTPQEWAAGAEVWRSSIHPEDRERVLEEWEEAVRSESAFESEYRMVRSDGRVVWVRDQSHLVRDSGGRPLCWHGVFTDVTDRHRRERQLRRTNQALRALIEASPLAIAAVDLSAKVTLWNPAAERMFGWRAEEVLGKAMPIIPDDARDEWRGVLDAGARGDVVSRSEARRVRRDGSFIDVEIARAPIREASGQIVGIFGIFTDISERKRAERAIRASEERYRGLFENALDIVFTTDLHGNFTAVNRAAERVNGYSREELLGMNIVELIAPEHRHVVEQVLELTPQVPDRDAAREIPNRYELDVVTKDGRRRSLEAVIRLVWDGDDPVAIEGIARDVTDRRLGEEALRASEERYRELFENANDLIYTHDLEGRITSLNKVAEATIGVPREQLLGRNIWELVAPEHVELAREMTRRKLAHGGTTRYEIDVIASDGHRVQLEVNTRLIYDDGRPVGVQGIARDVGDRRRAEEALQRSERHFRSLIDNALDVIAVLNEDLTIRYGSPSLEKVIGYGSGEVLGRSAVDLLHPDDVPPVLQAVEWAIAHPGQSVGIEVRVRHRDGQWRVLEGIGVSLLDDPAVEGIVVNARDVTERKQYEEGLRFLSRASEVVTSSLEVDETLRELARVAVPAIADWCLIQLVDEDGRAERPVIAHAEREKNEWARKMLERYPPDIERPGGLRDAIREGHSTLHTDVPPELLEAAAHNEEHRTLLADLGIGSVIVVPVRGSERTHGAIALVASASRRRYSERELQLAEELGRRAGLAVDNARLFRAAKDSLTMLRKTDEERRRLLAHLVKAQEEERSRIAVDIHDDSLQIMVAVGMRLEMLERNLADEADKQEIRQLQDTVADSIQRLRALLFNVRPPVLDTDGLSAALALYVTHLRNEIGVKPDIDDRLDAEPPDEIRTLAYRIAVEALQNVRKHSRAERVSVTLESVDDGIRVRVTDDGVGFSPEELEERLPGHLGLVAMRERAEMAGGWCRIDSVPGVGTTVEFWLPLQRSVARAS